MEIKFDTSELDKLSRELLMISGDVKNGKYMKRFLRSSGSKAQRRVKAVARQDPTLVHERTGNLMKGIRRGKVYKSRITGNWTVRVIGGKPAYHAHLIEYGHEKWLFGTYVGGRVQGFDIFEKGADVYKDEFLGDVDNFVDDLLYRYGFY